MYELIDVKLKFVIAGLCYAKMLQIVKIKQPNYIIHIHVQTVWLVN
jgi:hypothetical protein